MMTLLMAAFMSISFTACSSNDDNNGGNSGTSTTTETLVVKVNNAELIFICVPGGTYEFAISRKDAERNAFNVNLSGTMNDFYMSQKKLPISCGKLSWELFHSNQNRPAINTL